MHIAIAFAAGAFAGVFAGVFLMSLLSMTRDQVDGVEHHDDEESVVP